MTDSEMKKVFESLKNEDLNEVEMAISMMVAVGMAKKNEFEKSRTVVSER